MRDVFRDGDLVLRRTWLRQKLYVFDLATRQKYPVPPIIALQLAQLFHEMKSQHCTTEEHSLLDVVISSQFLKAVVNADGWARKWFMTTPREKLIANALAVIRDTLRKENGASD